MSAKAFSPHPLGLNGHMRKNVSFFFMYKYYFFFKPEISDNGSSPPSLADMFAKNVSFFELLFWLPLGSRGARALRKYSMFFMLFSFP